MESSFSAFPIVFQQEPRHGRAHGRGTFIRAHVMRRYHGQRRASLATKILASHERKGSRGAGGDNPSKSLSRTHTELDVSRLVECSAPSTFAGPDYSDSQLEKSGAATASSKNRKPRARRSRGEHEFSAMAPKLVELQLRDPRIQQAPLFKEISSAYFEILQNRRTPLDPLSKNWLPAAFGDVALFHAILFNFSQQLFALCSIDHETPAFLQHKVSAIRQISIRIENRGLGCSDAVIACILCLISHELLNGDFEAIKVHICGLRQIIHLRGGPSMLGLQGTLKVVYLSYELLLATVFRSNSNKFSVLSRTKLLSNRGPPCMEPVNIPTLIPTPQCIDADFNKLMKELYIYDRYFNAKDLSMFPKKTNGINHEEDTKDSHLLAAIQFAASLQYTSLGRVAAVSLVEQLKYHLNEMSVQAYPQQSPTAHLFCLVVGLAFSKSTSYRPWFVANLIRLTTGLAFQNLNWLRDCLYHFGDLGIVG